MGEGCRSIGYSELGEGVRGKEEGRGAGRKGEKHGPSDTGERPASPGEREAAWQSPRVM